MYAYLPSFFLTTTMGMSQDVSKCLKRPWLPTTLRSPGRGCRRCSWAAQLPWWVRLRPPWQQPSTGSWWRWPEALGLGRNHPSFLVGKLQPTISFQHLLLGRNPFKACCFLLFLGWFSQQKRYRISKQMFLQMCPFQNNPENNPPAPAFLLNPVFSLGKSVNPMIVGSLLSFSSWSANCWLNQWIYPETIPCFMPNNPQASWKTTKVGEATSWKPSSLVLRFQPFRAVEPLVSSPSSSLKSQSGWSSDVWPMGPGQIRGNPSLPEEVDGSWAILGRNFSWHPRGFGVVFEALKSLWTKIISVKRWNHDSFVISDATCLFWILLLHWLI